MEAILKIDDIELVCAVDSKTLKAFGKERTKQMLMATLGRRFIEQYENKIIWKQYNK